VAASGSPPPPSGCLCFLFHLFRWAYR